MSRSTQLDDDLRSVRQQAEEVFGDSNVAEDWLNTPNRLLDSRTPAEVIATGNSAAVQELLDRISYGIFS